MKRALWNVFRALFAVFTLAWSHVALAQWDIQVTSDGNGNVLSDGDRQTRVGLQLASMGIVPAPGDTIVATFSDGWKQTFTVTGTANNISIVAVPGTLSPPPPPIINARDCVSGAATLMVSYNGPGTPLYRATYACSGNTCVLISAVLIGYIGGLPTYEQLGDFGGYCESSYSA